MNILVLVTCICIAFVSSQDEFYIKSSSSDTCSEGTQYLTLSQFVTRNVDFDNVSLNFHPGNHALSSTLVFQRMLVVRIKKSNGTARSTIQCTCSGRIDFIDTVLADIYNIEFKSCRLQVYYSYVSIINSTFLLDLYGQIQKAYLGYKWGHGKAGVIVSQGSSITLFGSSFERNRAELGAAVFAVDSVIEIKNSSFTNNQALCAAKSMCLGGVLYSNNSTITVQFSNFQNNSVSRADDILSGLGGVFALFKSSASIRNSYFASNIAIQGSGGVIYAQRTDLNITASSFFSNRAAQFGRVIQSPYAAIVAGMGGVFHIYRDKSVLIENCTFSDNSASEMGGVLIATTVNNFTITQSVFERNYATQGGVIYATNFTCLHMHDVTLSNNAGSLGIMYFIESTGIISGYSEFATNIGSLFAHNSNITISGDTTFVDSYTSNTSHKIFSEGGAITAFQSEVILHGLCKFKNNSAEGGGAVYATESQVYISGNIIMSNNTAVKNGGGMFLYQSELTCQGNSKLSFLGNVATERGGAIQAVSSSIKTIFIVDVSFSAISQIIFIENHATKGGAVSLKVNAKLYVFIKVNTEPHTFMASLTFARNKADFGGAIYVADDTNSGICSSPSFRIHFSSTECFLQALGLHGRLAAKYTYVNFTNNKGKISGAALYGGLLDRCTVSPFVQVYSLPYIRTQSQEQASTLSGTKYFEIFSNIKLSSISSEPVRICFCDRGHPDCDYQPPPIQRKKGERFTIALVAVDQVGSPLSGVNILSSLSSNLGGLGVNQSNQTTAEGCTPFQYEVYSPHTIEQLNIHAVGPCNDAILSQRMLVINFTTCSCPIGFQQKVSDKENCVCECDSKLDGYIKRCDLKTASFIRKGNPWISYVTSSDNSSNGYLIYPHCPLDYCFPPGSNILININKPNGSDALCQHKRSGLLCGACRPELSLSLGTIRCVSCPQYWPALLVLQLVGSLIAGIMLVTALMMLNLTVADGSINGIIFYVNILYNFIPSFISHSRITFSSVFVSWLNLELGFDSCFFKGMDAYSKTWVELLFPTYVIFLVITIILVSEWSKKFSHLIGRRNPVATLATLILFSYAKVLSIIIKVLSFAIINYPGLQGPTKTVRWLPDASVEFFRGKHIPLGIGAIILLLFCVIFTALVFSWQWLGHFDDIKILKLVKSQKMSHFIETYHAPYTPRNRYWTGLLLIIRMVLYVASSINVSGDPNVNLLIIGLIISSVVFLKEITGINSQIYKKWPIEILEVSIFMNIIVLCVSVIFTNVTENKEAKEAIVNTSVAIVFLQFLGIICYRGYSEIFTKIKLWKICTGRNFRALESQEELQLSLELSSTAPTSSVIDLEKSEQPASQLMSADTGLHTELREPLLEQTE